LSKVLERLHAFLPQLREANAALDGSRPTDQGFVLVERGTEDADDDDDERMDDDDSEGSQDEQGQEGWVRMVIISLSLRRIREKNLAEIRGILKELGLGVFEAKKRRRRRHRQTADAAAGDRDNFVATADTSASTDDDGSSDTSDSDSDTTSSSDSSSSSEEAEEDSDADRSSRPPPPRLTPEDAIQTLLRARSIGNGARRRGPNSRIDVMDDVDAAPP
jgi:hypothetical protein